MNEQTSQVAMSALHQVRPWRRGMAWWAVLLEGLIALGIGIYILIHPSAGAQIVLLLALFLLLINLERAIVGFRDLIPLEIMAERMLRAGIGLTVGLIIVINAYQPFMNGPAPLVILSLGWLLIGAVGIWEWMTARKELGFGFGSLIFPVISALFGLLMLVSRLSLSSILLQSLGILAIVASIALLAYAFYLYRKNASPAPEVLAQHM